jgi:diguanylate cyclase (GGDEF)-like protein
MTAALPERQRPAIALLRRLPVATLLVFAVVLVWNQRHPAEQATWLASVAVVVSSTILCLVRAALVRRERAAWLCLGLGLVSYLAGNFVYEFWASRQDPVPFPSVSDALFLGFYPFAYCTLVLLFRRRVAAFQSSLWLDGVVGGLGAAAIGAALAFQTIMDATGGAPAAAVATNLAYPIADLLLLVLVVGVMALTGWHPGRAWWLLAGGFVLFAVADTLYLLRVAEGTYRYGTWLELLWPAAGTLIGVAAWSPPRAGQQVRMGGWTVLVVPSLFAVSSLGVLLLDHFSGVSTLAVALATGCLLACVVRTVTAFLEVRSLAESRRQAHTDDLTGLGNRRLLYAELHAAMRSGGEDPRLALLVLDLDRFKEVNDALGHEIGDQLLRLVGPRLAEGLDPGDVLVRLGGDEFAVLIRDADSHRAAAMASRLLGTLEAPFTSKESASTSTRASASRSTPTTPPTPPCCCSAPTWRCTRPRRPAPAGTSTRPSRPRPAAAACRPSRTSARRSPTTSSCSTTSPRSTPPAARSSASRRWSAGSTRPRACCTRTPSCRWPSRPG